MKYRKETREKKEEGRNKIYKRRDKNKGTRRENFTSYDDLLLGRFNDSFKFASNLGIQRELYNLGYYCSKDFASKHRTLFHNSFYTGNIHLLRNAIT